MKQGDTVNDRYQIVRHIGGGGMAQVYEVVDKRTNLHVALKILNTEHVRKTNSIERFKREGKLLCRLQHPNLVRGFELGQHEGRPFIIMEYIDGPSIGELIAKRGRLSAEEALKLLLDIALGLDHLFVRGAIQAHRDVKPGNILVTNQGVAKLTDFGIAKASSEEDAMTMTSTFLGSPNYMSPEQILDPRTADVRSDIYALGAVLWEMLTGEKAYDGRSTKEILDSHFELAAPQLDGNTPVIAQCNEILRLTLAHDMNERYQTPRALIEAVLPMVGAGVEVNLPRFSTATIRMAAGVVGATVLVALVLGGLVAVRQSGMGGRPLEPTKVVGEATVTPVTEIKPANSATQSAPPSTAGKRPERTEPTVRSDGSTGRRVTPGEAESRLKK